MNMISTGAFLNEMDASNKQPTVAEKFAAVWEKKNAKAARAGGVSLMALSLAACGSSSSDDSSAGVDSDADADAPAVSAQAIVLETGVDDVTGGAGDDTISGARVDTVATWSSSDSIDGGEGTDTLTAVINANVTPGEAGVTNVENIVVTAIGGATIDFSSATKNFITGATSLTNKSSTGATNFEDITGLAEMSVENIASQTTLFQYNDSVLSGADDTVTLNVSGAVGAITIGTNTDADGDYETLIVNATGANSDMVAGGGLGGDVATVTVKGDAAMDFGTTASFAKLATFNAADNSGGVTAVFAADGVTGATNTKTITGSSAGDTIDISAITAASVGAVSVDLGAGNDTLDIGDTGATDFTLEGGDGTDTLTVSAVSAAATHGGVSGFETLVSEVDIANTATTTMDMALFTGNSTFTRVDVEGTLVDGTTAAATDIFSITNAGANIATLGLGELDVTDARIDFARLVDTTTNSLTIKATQTAGSEAAALNANNEETVTFDSNTGHHDHTAVSLTDMTTLIAVGDHDVDLGTVTASKLATVDLTGLTTGVNGTGSDDEGDFIADLSSSTKAMTITSNASHSGIINVTTGSGADNVTGTANNDTISTGTNSDTIDGGAGDDEITGGYGVDTITGGSGSDDFNIVATQAVDGASALAGLYDVITDFTAQTSAGAAVDMLSVNLDNTAAIDLNETSVQLTTGSGVDSGDVTVYTGGNVINVSGTNTQDLAAINAALFDGDAVEASDDSLVVFSADTDGNGTGDEVQVWVIGETGGTASDADFAYHIATLSNIDASSDLAGVFVAGNFEII